MVKKLFMVAIVGFAIAMAIPSQRAKVERGMDAITDRIGVWLVPGRLGRMTEQINARFERGEGFPNHFETWLRLSFSGSELDPWDNVYYIEVGRRDYTVGSMGPDALQGTEDDIRRTVPTPGVR